MLNKVGNGVLIVPKHVWEKDSSTRSSSPTRTPSAPDPSSRPASTVRNWCSRGWIAIGRPTRSTSRKLIFHKNAGGNQVEQLKLSQGVYDTNAMFVPDIAKVYVNRDPAHNHYWYPPGGLISLGFNLTKAPFNDPQFRKAVAYAIDRDAIKTKAEYGYVTAASQTGPGAARPEGLAPSQHPQSGMIPYDPKQAADILGQSRL